MWERIGASSGIIIGVVVLFVIVVAALYLIERAEARKPRRRRKVLYLVPKQRNGERYAVQTRAQKPDESVRNIEERKIV